MGNSDSKLQRIPLIDALKEGVDDVPGQPKDANMNVPEYPYMASRLQPIDYQDIISRQKSNPITDWCDPHFKANKKAILDPMIRRDKRVSSWENFVWKRPHEVYGHGNFAVFNDIKPDDIKQGHCGDCYYLSCLSSIAEHPQRIKDIFLTKEVNQAGCYAVSLWVDGQPREVVIDDLFPYDIYKEQWAFSRTNQNEIWVLLLEKAWAKVYGSYHRIESGTTGEALPYLTGAPSSIYHHETYEQKPEILWNLIENADKRGYIMTTAVSSQASDIQSNNDMTKVGLVDAHAYSLIAALEVNVSRIKKEKLVLLRNPWGFREWSGDWSDDSKKWTEFPDAEKNI